jgi:hypothetical protein
MSGIGGLFIEGTSKTTFSSCTATDIGGAIYLDLTSNTEGYFNFSGASYSSNTATNNGASLFINA